MSKNATKVIVSLGQLQSDLERAASELKAAQTVFNSAASRLARADEAYTIAVSSLNTGVMTLRAHTKINPNL